MKKSISNLESNYAGAQSDEDVAVGILNFDYSGHGHKLAEYCLR